MSRKATGSLKRGLPQQHINAYLPYITQYLPYIIQYLPYITQYLCMYVHSHNTCTVRTHIHICMYAHIIYVRAYAHAPRPEQALYDWYGHQHTDN